MTPEYSSFRKPERANSYEVRTQDNIGASNRSGDQSRNRNALFGSHLRRNVSFSIDTQSANYSAHRDSRPNDGGFGNARSLMLNSLISPRHEYPRDVYQSGFADGLGLLPNSKLFDTESREGYGSIEPDNDPSSHLDKRLTQNENFDNFRHHNNKAGLNSAGLPVTTASFHSSGSNGNSQIDTRARSNTIPIARPTPLVQPPMNGLSGNFGPFHANNNGYGPKKSHERSSGMSPPPRSVPVSRRNSNDRLNIWEDFKSLTLNEPKMHTNDGARMAMFNENNGQGVHGQQRSGLEDVHHNPSSDFPGFSEMLVFEEDNINSGYNQRYPQTTNKSKRFPSVAERNNYSDLLSTSSAALDLAYLPQTSRQTNGGMNGSEWEQYSSTQLSDHGYRQTRPPLRQTASMYISTRKGPPPSINTVMYANEMSKQEAFLSENVTSPISNIDPGYNRIQQYPNNARDLSDMPTSPSSNVCRFFQQGHCSRGDRCTFVHVFKSISPDSPRSILSPVSAGGNPFNYPVSPLSPTFYNQMNSNGFPPNNYSMSSKHGFNNPNSNNGKSVQPNPNGNKQVSKRASSDVEASNRFSGIPIEDMIGEIYSLCKDQHGCRYLQKKLEEQNPKYLDIIFHEVFGHFVELMTDPFGNYLCQKLLEFCNDEQRTIIVETVAPELVNIALNMHGTRAVQKMIEFLSNSQQIRMIMIALNPNIVTLIKDLNGNHVIQKCLNRLKPADNQFIYNGVCKSLIEVATHRHGCCVLQRCIDYSSESQKRQLVSEITYHALTLVQDPFGNYVVQYVLDLNEGQLSDPLIRRFVGNVCLLSVQKFSSNVMEKCIRVSKLDTRQALIEELLSRERLDKLLRDSFGNYVVQTALDYAEVNQRAMLVDAIRPLLPAIRNTPYGKRIQGKLQREQVHPAPQHSNMINYGYNNMAPPNYGAPMNLIGMNDIGYNYM